jgi:hypothetical protein
MPFFEETYAMRRATVSKPTKTQIACLLWIGLFLVATTSSFSGHRRTVTHHYQAASEHWFAGQALYRNDGDGFLYFPQSAILYSPFAFLPGDLGEIVWRGAILGVFAYGVFRLTQVARRTSGIDFFALTTIICVPLAFSSERNGQATLIMAGLMMLAASELVDERWWRAAMYLSLAVAIKPLSLVLAVMAVILYPETIRPLAACALFWILVPFVTADGQYVVNQYMSCESMLHAAVDRGHDANWAQVFGLLQVVGVDMPPVWRLLVQTLAAVATLGLGWYAQRRMPRNWAGIYCYGLAICYLMLFNPRTENNSYSALGPMIGLICCNDVLVRRRYMMSMVYIFVSLGIIGTYYVGLLVTGPKLTMWLAPLAGACFTALAVVKLLVWPETEFGRRFEGAAGGQPPSVVCDPPISPVSLDALGGKYYYRCSLLE